MTLGHSRSNRIEKGRLYLGASEVKILKNEDVGKPYAFEIYFNDATKKKVGITLACKSMDELMTWVEAVQSFGVGMKLFQGTGNIR